MRSKYHATKTVVDGITFDSKKEAERYKELKMLEQAGAISGLERQKRYELTPTIRERGVGADKELGRVIERPSYYVADFVYKAADGSTVVEDVKSPITRTREYVLKRKLMLYLHGIRIKET